LSISLVEILSIGLFGGSIELNLPLIPLRSYHIMGSYTGRLAHLPDLVGLAKRHIIKPIVSKTFMLDEANEAITQLKSGRITGRAVIDP
jgi:propanol-preferring alcohol dehydrogenase